MTTIIEQSVCRARTWILRSGRPISAIALDAGLSSRTLKQFRDEEWNPTRKTLERLERLIPKDFDPDQIDEDAAA